jgi:hypothetical protein
MFFKEIAGFLHNSMHGICGRQYDFSASQYNMHAGVPVIQLTPKYLKFAPVIHGMPSIKNSPNLCHEGNKEKLT